MALPENQDPSQPGAKAPNFAAVERSDRNAVEAIDPETGKRMTVYITHRRQDWVAQQSRGAVMEMAYCVPHVLQNPKAIFQGIRRDEDDDRDQDGWLCYCGTPKAAHRKDGTTCPPYPNEVFLVFVNREKVAYLWYWSECDGSCPDLPVDHERRFWKKVLP